VWPARLFTVWVLILGFAGSVVVACVPAPRDGAVETATARVLAAYPHDPRAFTQGLAIHDGMLYESTGRYGRSRLRIVDPERGEVQRQVALDDHLFGEGIAILGGRLYQLTWKAGVVLVYDPEDLRLLTRLDYPGEAWGLTHDGTRLILSDGTPVLRFLTPDTFEVVREVRVTDGRRSVRGLNELEWVNGQIWANILGSDRIARISPASGDILGWIDLGHLYPRARRAPNQPLNGIARDPQTGRLFVTGKLWPRLFEVSVDQPSR
jgi:glutamine cyclotransferase